jgi:glucose dehydrogenase
LLQAGTPYKLGIATAVLTGLVLIYVFVRFGGKRGFVLGIVTVAILGVVGFRYRSEIRSRVQGSGLAAMGGLYAPHFGAEFGYNTGAPYSMYRSPLENGHTICGPVPFGAVAALNLNTGKSAWATPLGTKVPGQKTGTWSVGGPIVTAGGLVFTAASPEPYLRAFDSATGEEVWKGDLPVPAQATPMTYVINGKQYIVVSAGGHPSFGTPVGDAVVAFALP